MVSAMILLLGSQVDMFAQQRKGGPDFKRPGMEMYYGKPGKPMDKKAISQGDIKMLQDFYWKKYRVRLSKKEAEKILLEERKGCDRFGYRPGPGPRGPQKPPRK